MSSFFSNLKYGLSLFNRSFEDGLSAENDKYAIKKNTAEFIVEI